MPYKIKNERTVRGQRATPLEGQAAISLTVMIDWGNPAIGHSYEEVEVSERATDAQIRVAIRQKINALRPERAKNRAAFPSRHERAKEFGALDRPQEQE